MTPECWEKEHELKSWSKDRRHLEPLALAGVGFYTSLGGQKVFVRKLSRLKNRALAGFDVV